MTAAELHAKGAVWRNRSWHFAALFLEGEAPDRSSGTMLVDALHLVARARGLRLITDLDQISLQPVPKWRVLLNARHAVTLEWPHSRPLLANAPIELPHGWHELASAHGIVLVFAGYGLGLHEQSRGDAASTTERLVEAAWDGALAGAAVRFDGAATVALAGMTGRPRRVRRHRRQGRGPAWPAGHATREPA
ncbi:hypothetical protein [Haloechinothrix sp. LS1_15]|uniref:hypothetical protein n=1 Tax=Haloechinothrix sp. LS1_15 TaxID=2652248 RepID=UPI002945A168|nr:hypothetical protein [Haloechinothrix sp. LS1_15]MDV6013612.1 hypothetical protein [Haloechinothrix sp. LS1_15]